MPTDIGPHDLTSGTSHSPYKVYGSNDYFANPAYKAFDSAAGDDFHINQGGAVGTLTLDLSYPAGTEKTVHDGGSTQTINASSQHGSFPKANVLSNNTAYWLGTNSGVDWLSLDFGSGNDFICRSYWLRMNDVPEPARAPQNWTFEGSNDGSSWTVVHTVTGQTGWESGEIRYFEPSSTSTSYRYYRINITANNGDGTYTQIDEIFLYSTALDTSTRKTCGTYSVQVATTAARCPKTWKLQGNNHQGGGWVDLDTVASETSWGSNESRSFTVDDSSTAYISFRLNFTANNGDGTYTEIKEFSLFVATGGPTGIDVTVSDSYTLSDSIASLLIALLEQAVSDSISLSDSILSDLFGVNPVNVSDTLVIGDSLLISYDYWVVKSDSFTLSDSFGTLGVLAKILLDSLAISDSIVSSGDSPLEFDDRLVLTDLAIVSVPGSDVPSDTLSLSDNAIIVLSINLILSDSLAITDNLGIHLNLVISITVGDAIVLSDSLTTFISTGLTSYLRDYLNDVQGIRTPESIADPDVESPGPLNDYLRRYLNDVT